MPELLHCKTMGKIHCFPGSGNGKEQDNYERWHLEGRARGLGEWGQDDKGRPLLAEEVRAGRDSRKCREGAEQMSLGLPVVSAKHLPSGIYELSNPWGGCYEYTHFADGKPRTYTGIVNHSRVEVWTWVHLMPTLLSISKPYEECKSP